MIELLDCFLNEADNILLYCEYILELLQIGKDNHSTLFLQLSYDFQN